MAHKWISLLGMLAMLASLVIPALAAENELVERLSTGSINWSQSMITAKGSGIPPAGMPPAQARIMAERAAKADALRNLLETVKGVRVDAETLVENFTVRSDVILTRVNGIVQGASVVARRFLNDGSVEVTVAMPLMGDLLAVMMQEVPPLNRPLMPSPSTPVYPQPMPPVVSPPKGPIPSKTLPPPRPTETKGTPPLPVPEKKLPPPPAIEAKMTPPPPPPAIEAKMTPPPPPPPAIEAKMTPPPPPPAVEAKVLPPPAEPQGTPPPLERKKAPAVPDVQAKREEPLDLKKVQYTGLIVDGRKLGLRPALIPKILNQKGELVYGQPVLEQKDMVKMGLVGYAKDVDAAARNQRVTAEPYVIVGLNAAGEKRTDVVIPDREAQVVLTTAPYTGYLKNGRVMIVYE